MTAGDKVKAANRLKALRTDEANGKKRFYSHESLKEALEKRGTKISVDSLMNYEASDKLHAKFGSVAGMKVETLYALADFYGVSTDYILGRTDVTSVDATMKAVSEYTGLSGKTIKALQDMNKKSYDSGWDAINFILSNPNFQSMFLNMLDMGRVLRNHKKKESIIEEGDVLYLKDLGGTVSEILNVIKSGGKNIPPYLVAEHKDEMKRVLVDSFGEDAAIVSVSKIVDYSSYLAQTMLTYLIEDVKRENSIGSGSSSTI